MEGRVNIEEYAVTIQIILAVSKKHILLTSHILLIFTVSNEDPSNFTSITKQIKAHQKEDRNQGMKCKNHFNIKLNTPTEKLTQVFHEQNSIYTNF